jgi:hypothetical protein
LEKIPSPSKIISQLVEKPDWMKEGPYIFAQFVYNACLYQPYAAFSVRPIIFSPGAFIGAKQSFKTTGTLAAACGSRYPRCL